MKIYYIHHADIDKKKWDQCISDSKNELIYAYSYYLDVMSKNWDALVMCEGLPSENDYKAVMPLTWNKKFGILYLRQPVFTQQLGIFGNCSFTENITKSFIDIALERFPFVEINLNYANEYQKYGTKKCNCILPLNQDFPEIEKSFRRDFVNKIKSNTLIYQSSDEVEKAIQLFKENYSDRVHISKKDFENWRLLCILLKNKGQLFVREVKSQSWELLSIALFLKNSNRIYYISSTTLPEGRKQESNYFLLYHLIKEFSNQNLIFDFEGSEIPSIKLFFKKFGAIEQNYTFVRINNLIFWKRWLKDISDHLRK